MEMVVYMGILSILLLLFIDMFAMLVNKQLETEGISAVQQDAQYVFSRLSYDFGRANSISLPTSPSSPAATLRLLIDSTLFTYSASSSALIATASGSINQLNSAHTSISNLTFQRLGTGNRSDVIQVRCDISSKVKKQSGYEVTHFATTYGIREK